VTFEKLQLLNTSGSSTNTKSFEPDKFKTDKEKESINQSLVCTLVPTPIYLGLKALLLLLLVCTLVDEIISLA
jgi:hypothetical protein